jgi:phosphate/sulfate permease
MTTKKMNRWYFLDERGQQMFSATFAHSSTAVSFAHGYNAGKGLCIIYAVQKENLSDWQFINPNLNPVHTPEVGDE